MSNRKEAMQHNTPNPGDFVFTFSGSVYNEEEQELYKRLKSIHSDWHSRHQSDFQTMKKAGCQLNWSDAEFEKLRGMGIL